MKKVAIIGHFGFGHTCLDGQTVKTAIVTDELQEIFGSNRILRIDTYGGAKTLLKAPFQVLHALKNAKNVLIFPAHNGLRVYAPLLAFFNRFFRRKLHYAVIGGWLPEFLKNRKSLSQALKRFDGIYVETNTMKKALEAQGLAHVYVMPNCKKLTILSENELIYPEAPPYKLCTFSRVMKEKGIEDAVRAVQVVNEELGKTIYSLDIYGQVDVEQTAWFENLKCAFPEYVRYCGVVDYDKSTDVLKNYFALLFPTYYEGEGFAGTLIDAFSAGVPVIASNWKYNTEIVNQNVGFVYPTGDEQALVQALKAIARQPSVVFDKKQSCLQESDKYKTQTAVRILAERLEDDEA